MYKDADKRKYKLRAYKLCTVFVRVPNLLLCCYYCYFLFKYYYARLSSNFCYVAMWENWDYDVVKFHTKEYPPYRANIILCQLK